MRAQLANDHRQRGHGLRTVSAAIVQQNDASAAALRLLHHTLHDLFGSGAGIVAPVVRVDLVADGDVAHFLRDFQRTHLIGRIRLLVDRVGRTEQDRLDTQLGFEQALGQIQLDHHVALGDSADVRVREGMIPDLMPLAEDALQQTGIFFPPASR